MRFLLVVLLAIASCTATEPKVKATEAVTSHIKTTLHDPASYEPGQWWVQPKYVDSVGGKLEGWEIKHRWRAKNAFGALVQEEAIFMVDTFYHVAPFNDPYFGL